MYDFEFVAIDFEFNRVKEPNVHPVAGAFRAYGVKWDLEEGKSGRIYPIGDVESFWLCDDTDNQQAFNQALFAHTTLGRALLCFGGVAETRAMTALGWTYNDFKMLDLYPLWMQLKHTWKKWQYGKYVNRFGELTESEPPKYSRLDGTKLPGDYTPLMDSLASACAAVLGKKIDAKHKEMMRDLIISDPEQFKDDEIQAIMRYNESDILNLPQLLMKMVDEFRSITGLDGPTVARILLQHGDFVKSQGIAEDRGIPADVGRMINLRSNYENAKETLLTNLCALYPFYEKEYEAGELKMQWKKKSKNFNAYIESIGLIDTWPRTEPSKLYPKGQLKSDEDTLEAYEGQYEPLKMLRQVSKSINQIGWFEGNRESNILNYIGPDGRIRTWLAPFGTLTGRNAPKPSKGYIPAMAKWLRGLISPPEGYKILEYDWSSQEFLIAAALSGDEAMLEAYKSGDPYTYFAKAAGAIPPEGSKKTHPEVRNLFKSTTLGLQYGMGVDKLALKLSSDTGKSVTTKEAQKLMDLHKRIFRQMWKWRDRIISQYEHQQLIILDDGWCLFPDNDSNMSTANFPVQGTGACIFREACRRASEKGLHLIYGLHDALRILVKNEDAEESKQILLDCMAEAVEKFLKGHIIRNEGKTVEHGVPFIEEGSEKMYEMMKQYLDYRFEEVDEAKIISELFSN